MMHQAAITTFDNPFDPFEQFDSWYEFDMEKGYNSCSRIMRLANITDEMSQEEVNAEKERAIDRLIEIDCLNVYKKVTKELTDNESEDSE